MPESTTSTHGSDAAKRSAHDATDAAGAAAESSARAASGSTASAPPRTGSMTITRQPCRSAVS